MQPWRDVVLNSRGEPIEGLSVQVLTDPGGIAATIYSDDGVTLADNPLTTDSDGNYFFFAADGRYQVIISGTNITTKTIDGIVLDDSSGLALPVAIASGGTGATTAAGARTNLGSTATGDSLFTAANAAAARTALGATAVGDGVFVAANDAAARAAIGAGVGDFLADGSVVMTGDLQLGAARAVIFEGTTADAFETTFSAGEPTADRTITLPDQTGLVRVTGKETIFVPAGAMTARTTNGAAAGTVESATNKVMLKTLDFDAGTDEYAQFAVRMPKSWDEGTITAAFLWTANSTSTNSVIWGIQGVALSDNDAIDTAFGAAQTVTDANGSSAYTERISGATAAVTIGNTPAAEDWVVFQVYRDAAAGGDTLAADALLLGVTLYYTTDSTNDA